MNFSHQIARSIYLKRAGLDFLNEAPGIIMPLYDPTPTSAEIRIPATAGGLGIWWWHWLGPMSSRYIARNRHH